MRCQVLIEKSINLQPIQKTAKRSQNPLPNVNGESRLDNEVPPEQLRVSWRGAVITILQHEGYRHADPAARLRPREQREVIPDKNHGCVLLPSSWAGAEWGNTCPS